MNSSGSSSRSDDMQLSGSGSPYEQSPVNHTHFVLDVSAEPRHQVSQLEQTVRLKRQNDQLREVLPRECSFQFSNILQELAAVAALMTQKEKEAQAKIRALELEKEAAADLLNGETRRFAQLRHESLQGQQEALGHETKNKALPFQITAD